MNILKSFAFSFFMFVGAIANFSLAFGFRETYFWPIFVIMAFICFVASVLHIVEMREG